MPRLLDLFCKQGGCSVGYARAGWDVEGVDIKPQPRYPYTFHQGDALAFLREHGHRFDAIHASPPCQRYTTGGRVKNREQRPDLLGPTRDALDELGKPYVIENVPEAPIRADLVLCGSMFGLEVRRHRLFECSLPLAAMLHPCDHSRPVAGVYGKTHGKAGAWPGMLPSTVEVWSRAMGIDWMDAKGLAEAIPPAYTELIGRALLEALNSEGRPLPGERPSRDAELVGPSMPDRPGA